MARPQKYSSKTKTSSFRLPMHIVQCLDVEARKRNLPRAEILAQILIERYGDKPLKRSVFD